MRHRLPAFAFCACVAIAGHAGAAQRTFVSTSGSDSNPCSLAAPCRSFTSALGNTDPKGEIIVLESGGYGALTVNKSVTIQSPGGVYAGISVFSGAGVTVNAAGATVILRGLTINGQGGTTGINLIAASTLHVEDCVVSGMNGTGIALSGTGEAFIKNSTIRDNGATGLDLSGVLAVNVDNVRIESNATFGIAIANGATATVVRSTISRNGDEGVGVFSHTGAPAVLNLHDSVVTLNGGFVAVDVFADASGSVVRGYVVRSTISGNGGRGISSENIAGATAIVSISDSHINDNGSHGVRAVGDAATMVIAGNTIAHNVGFGLLQQSSSTLLSKQDNVIHSNGSGDITGATTPLTLR